MINVHHIKNSRDTLAKPDMPKITVPRLKILSQNQLNIYMNFPVSRDSE